MKKIYFCIIQKAKHMKIKMSRILENATSQGHRSNVVKPLTGLLIIMIVACIILAYLQLEVLSIAFAVCALLIVVVFLVAYFYCLSVNPDLLRSEKFVLEKTAIENIALLGDSTTKRSLSNPDLDYVKYESTNDVSSHD